MPTEADLIRKLREIDARGGRYVFGAKGPKNYDCSGFTYAGVTGIGLPFEHGSKQQYDYCRRKGTLTSVNEALRTPGRLLFRIGVTPVNHVAVSLGNGSTIEAHSSKTGIGVFGGAANRRWTHGARVPGIGAPQSAKALMLAIVAAIRAAKRRVYRRGQRHNDIKLVQAKINQINPRRGLAVDGIFGPATEKAVRDFQRFFKLRVTGVVDAATWNKLYPGI